MTLFQLNFMFFTDNNGGIISVELCFLQMNVFAESATC